ncbi:hypothetical protein K402DRAFT_334433 [Aulographum hederae CBS 113979]|uniref:PQ loop repeat protein n=1 Tax=Aulographum hederae CBS 113979 TaxID=1176131 RepID=A0A6G1GWV9_9PEZI|nr:hypothetical protein K402DRAFT_334433 [Aulographum hederae CBS 113979]
MDVPVAANVLGTLGAVCWSVQLVPQIIINYRRHNTVGLQPSMMMLWAWAGVPLGVYNIVENFNVALRIQPQILTFLSLLTWIQCNYYEKNWSIPQALLIVIPIAAIMAGVEAALVFALRIGISRSVEWPLTLMAVLAAVLLAAGVLRHYWDIYVHRTVRGISFLFIGIDAAGDVFSLISVVFQPTLDVLGMVIYGTELVLWLGVFAAGGYFNLVPWITRRERGVSCQNQVQRGSNQSKRPRSTADPTESSHAGHGDGDGHGVMLHELPSSTSVFRTPSADVSFRGHRSVVVTREA